MRRGIPPEALKSRIIMINSKDLTVVISKLNEAKIVISDPKNRTKGCFSFIYGDLASGEYIACAMGALEGAGVAKAAYVYPVLEDLLEPDYEVPMEHNYLHQAMLSMERAFGICDESHRLSN